MNVERELARLRAPDERAAQARAWGVVRAAWRDIGPRPRRAPRWGLAPATLAAVALVAALALTPTGATVGRLIRQALGVPHATRALLPLPAPGRLLVSGSGETWILSGNGTRTRLGPWSQASWSPHGRYIAVASGDRLAAVDPHGATQWALVRPGVADPRWEPPTGFRVAYRSGRTLRVVAGDGTGDHLVASGVAAVAPAWRPGRPYQLAYVRDDRVVVRDSDTGHIIWTRPGHAVLKLDWSADGTRLLIVTRTGARVVAGTGATTATIATGRLNPVRDGSLSPGGATLALITSRGLAIARLGPPRPKLATVLPGAAIGQVTWSPAGRWLLASWPAADQWVFIAVGQGPRIAAVSRVAEQFSTGAGTGRFPQLDGWCCSAPARPG